MPTPDPALGWDPGYGSLVETRMRVMTWNIWARYGPWERRQPAIAEVLARVNPDIACLQEVWADREAEQAAVLAGALHYHHVYAPAFELPEASGGPEVWSGNAVLSRWPIVRHDVTLLPREGGGAKDDEGEERLVLFVELDGPRGPVQVFCTHLSWRSDHSGVRQEQVRALAGVVRARRPRPFPAVLCGDLNAPPDSEEIRMLTGLAAVPVPGVVFTDAWVVAGGGPGWTWSNDNPFAATNLEPEARIDYVLVGHPKLGGVGHVVAARVEDGVGADGTAGSDHRGVVAELRY